MALHLAENGCYGIKINPKEPGQELQEDRLLLVLAKFGEVKELQMPNKFLAFAFYVQYEEARNCLDSLQLSGDYMVKPGWPKQTTADEKSTKNNGKSMARDDTKGVNPRSKDNEEESQQQEQETPEETKNKTNGRVKFDLKKTNQESKNNGKRETDPSSTDQESQKINERGGTNNKYKNYKADDSPKINGDNKEIDNKSAVTKEEGRFGRQERIPRRPYRSEHPRRFRSRSECRKENRNAGTNYENTPKMKYTRGRSVDRAHYNFRYKKDADFKKNHFFSKMEYDQKNKEDKFSHQKNDHKIRRNAYHNRDGPAVSTEEKSSNNHLTDKRKDAVKQCVLVSAVDAWTADMIKFHKRTRKASYIIIFNLPVNINARNIYDLAKTWVEVIHVEIKYGTNIYIPPHAFVYTGSRKQSEILKSILNQKTLKHKILFVKTQKDLEE